MKRRETVEAFADAMEVELVANDHKGGWSECSPLWLLSELQDHLDRFNRIYTLDGIRAAHEMIDVANFAMMLWDRLRPHEEEQDK